MSNDVVNAKDLAISELDEIPVGNISDNDYFIIAHPSPDGLSYTSYKQNRKNLLKDTAGKDIFNYNTVFQMANPVMKPMFIDHDPNVDSVYAGKLYWVKAGWKLNFNSPLASDYYDSLTRLYSFIKSELASTERVEISVSTRKTTTAKNANAVDTVTIICYKSRSGLLFTADDVGANLVYNRTGVAWFYIVDSISNPTQLILPRTKWNFVGTRGNAGYYVKPGLPEHYHNICIFSTRCDCTSQAGIKNSHDQNAARFYVSTSNTFDTMGIYGESDTVQPPSTQMELWFAV